MECGGRGGGGGRGCMLMENEDVYENRTRKKIFVNEKEQKLTDHGRFVFCVCANLNLLLRIQCDQTSIKNKK